MKEKMLIISDSHGAGSLTEQLLQVHADIRQVVFCGDGLRDVLMANSIKGRNLVAVRGNVDRNSGLIGEDAAFFSWRGMNVLVTHGDRYGVKTGLYALSALARDAGADLVCYGHTHIQKSEQLAGVSLVNPGALGEGRYAIIESGSDGDFSVEFGRISMA